VFGCRSATPTHDTDTIIFDKVSVIGSEFFRF